MALNTSNKPNSLNIKAINPQKPLPYIIHFVLCPVQTVLEVEMIGLERRQTDGDELLTDGEVLTTAGESPYDRGGNPADGQ